MEVTLDELEIGRRIGAGKLFIFNTVYIGTVLDSSILVNAIPVFLIGACSNVHLATHVHTNVPYAVKFFSVYDEAQADQLLREVTMYVCDSVYRGMKGIFPMTDF